MQKALQHDEIKEDEKENITEVWRYLLKKIKLKKDATIVELAPGFKSKIDLAAAQTDYQGTYHLIEPNDAARASVLSSYQKIIQGRIYAHATFFQEIKREEDLPEKIDLLCANHALDDIVLAKGNSQEELCEFFSMNSGQKRIQKTKELWNKISDTQLNEYIKETVKEVYEFIKKLEPRITILSHYESKTLTENNILRPTIAGNKVSKLLYEEIQKNRNKKITVNPVKREYTQYITEAGYGENWMILGELR